MNDLLQIVVALLAGGIGSLLTLRSRQRKESAEARKANVDATDAEINTLAKLLGRVESLTAAQANLVEQNEECKREGVALRAEIADTRVELAHLKATYAIAVIGKRIENSEEFRDWLDTLSDPIVISSAENGGTWLWVNRKACEVLGRDLEEIVTLGWRGLICPEYLVDTERVERSAHYQRVWGYRNEYFIKSGDRVNWAWFCLPYGEDKTTIARMEVLAIVPAAERVRLPIRGDQPRLTP